MNRFFVMKDGKQEGPYTVDQIKKYNLPNDTLVYQKNTGKWKAIKNIPNFYSKENHSDIDPPITYVENFFSPKGRIKRSTLFIRNILLSIPLILINFSFDEKNNTELIFLFTIIILITTPLILIQIIKRLHDLNKSGWLCLLSLLPIINIIFGLYLLLTPGSKGLNDYGISP